MFARWLIALFGKFGLISFSCYMLHLFCHTNYNLFYILYKKEAHKNEKIQTFKSKWVNEKNGS